MQSLKEQFSEYKYKIELHAHTKPASPCSEVTSERLVSAYADLGVDGVAITNHFVDYVIGNQDKNTFCDNYLKDFYNAKNAGERLGVKVYLGMEVRFPEYCNDYLVFGVDENDVRQVFSYIFGDYISFYKAFKNDKNVIIQAHPFRDNMVLQSDEYLDGIEVFNMSKGHNSRNELSKSYADARPKFIKTCGSDFHREGDEGRGIILTKTLPDDSFGLAEILKKRDYLFCIEDSIIIP